MVDLSVYLKALYLVVLMIALMTLKMAAQMVPVKVVSTASYLAACLVYLSVDDSAELMDSLMAVQLALMMDV